MSDDNPLGFVGGDGGPLVVLQASAAAQWQGATDFDNSLMNGGTVETDYDIACDCTMHHTRRYDRDMLVLDDCEWSGRIFAQPDGSIVVLQHYYVDDKLPDIMERIKQVAPQSTFPITIEDTSLRLVVGADDGEGSDYGYSDLAVTPGPKRCDLYLSDDALVIVIKPA